VNTHVENTEAAKRASKKARAYKQSKEKSWALKSAGPVMKRRVWSEVKMAKW
jgi:hypothetical protein